MGRIILSTFGSLGDVHPYMAIALGLQARGHRAVIATSALYRRKVEAEGIGFHAVRPDLPDPAAARELIRRVMDARRGTEYVFRDLWLPHLRESYDDLTAAARGADLLITHPITFSGPLVAEKTGIRWVSSVLSPISFFSAHEPLVLPPSPLLTRLYALGPRAARVLLRLMR